MSIFDRAGMRARVAASSKDEVVLEEMVRHGFWPENKDSPSLPKQLIERQAEIRRELETLASDAAAYENKEQALKRLQKERMQAARERRKETKLKNAKARHERALAWHARQQKEITHLGEGVSAALHGKQGDPARLAQLKLPVLADPPAIAAAIGIPLGELRFLAYLRDVSKVDHYARFALPKKSGGVREIAAPMPRLKRAQYWILHNILAKLPEHDASHGFRTKRSIVSNALPHAGKRVVINMDLKDFFPTITYARVKGMFVAFGYPEKVAMPLALLCTDAERDKVEIDGRTWSVAREGRRLPQGAPSSPAIANIIANRLDKRLAGAAKKLGFTYTRYADDMTFSGDAAPGTSAINRMIWQARQIAEAEGFTVNDKKTRVMGSGTRQDVTGLVVNTRPAVPRGERRRFRAWLHAAEKAVQGKIDLPLWTNAKGVPSNAMGFASYLAMVDATTGKPLAARTKAVLFGGRPSPRAVPSAKPTASKREAFRQAAADGQSPAGNRWTPAVKPAPTQEPIETLKQQQAQPASSVPHVPLRSDAGQPRQPASSATSTRTPTRPPRLGADSMTSPETSNQAPKKPSLIVSLALSAIALALAVLPVIGPFVALVALSWIWLRYWRGNKGS